MKMVLLQNNVLRSARHKINKKTVNRTRNCTNISADPLLTSTKRLFVNLFLSYEQRNAKYLWCLSPCLGDLILLSFSSFLDCSAGVTFTFTGLPHTLFSLLFKHWVKHPTDDKHFKPVVYNTPQQRDCKQLKT